MLLLEDLSTSNDSKQEQNHQKRHKTKVLQTLLFVVLRLYCQLKVVSLPEFDAGDGGEQWVYRRSKVHANPRVMFITKMFREWDQLHGDQTEHWLSSTLALSDVTRQGVLLTDLHSLLDCQ